MIQHHWNKVVRNERPMKQRDYVYASELGMPLIDRFYKMQGVAPTNPFSERVLRIFDAGRVIEFIVLRSLAVAGILNKTQYPVELPETADTLKVTGRLDATIGGFGSWGQAREQVNKNLLQFKLGFDDEIIEGKAMNLIDGLQAEYLDGLCDEIVVEVKSINSTSFWNSKGNRDEFGHFLGYNHNKLQLYAYLHMTGLERGILFYVSKDDFTLEEVSVDKGDPELEEAFWEDLHTITRHVREDIVPDPEPAIVYNDRKGVFETNFAVERSPYLTQIYGFADAGAFEHHFHQELLDRNRVLKHIREGKVGPKDLPFIEMYRLEQYA